jgi:hypothetical protein
MSYNTDTDDKKFFIANEINQSYSIYFQSEMRWGTTTQKW